MSWNILLQKIKVVVIGRRVAPLNNSCYAPTDVIGWSYFEMFTGHGTSVLLFDRKGAGFCSKPKE